MSAPTPAPGDDSPREGYYPDPSIPGYVRYWNGVSWVPGTSRPAPAAGETLPRPPGVDPAPQSVEETGPVFFDEEPPRSAVPHQGPAAPDRADIPEQSGPDQQAPADREPTSAAARAHEAPQAHHPGIPEQAGPHDVRAGQDEPERHAEPDRQDRREGPAWREQDDEPAVWQERGDEPSWRAAREDDAADATGGAPEPETPGRARERARHAGRPELTSSWGADASRQSGFGGDQNRRVTWGSSQGADPRPAPADWPDAAAEQAQPPRHPDGTMPLRSADQGAASQGTSGPAPSEERGSSTRLCSLGRPDGTGEGTVTFRRPGLGPDSSSDAGAPPRRPDGSDGGTVTIRAMRPGAPQPQVPPQPGVQHGQFGGPQGPQIAPAAGNPPTMPYFPHQPVGPASPIAGHQADAVPPSWGAAEGAQGAGQGADEPVVPWKPPVHDPFLAAAQQQAASRPAPLGKRLAARLIDTVVVGGLTAVAAVPLGGKAVDHIDGKVDAARLSGQTVTVWLLDGTTTSCLGIVLAVLLVVGVLYEALPTAKWGRTLGKKLCGLQVRDIEAHDVPGFGAALRRWLVYSVPGVLVIGVLGVLWCLFDRPWRQCLHDKAAHTFVAS